MKDIIEYLNRQNASSLDSLLPPQVVGAINEMQEKIDFTGDELQRMEFESGNPLNASQNAEIATYSNLSKCLKKKLLKTKQT